MNYRISPEMLSKIGRNIRKVRESKKLNQLDIAESAGLNDSYYARIERGEANPTIEVLYAVIRVLGVHSSDILPF